MLISCGGCGARLGAGDRVCRACRSAVADGRPVELTPPRAGRRAWRRRSRWTVPPIKALSPSSRLVPLVALVPGLGHVLTGRLLAGLAVLAATVLLLIVGGSSVLEGGSTWFMVAASLHAWSIFDVLPGRKSLGRLRAAGITVGLNVGLLLFVYLPLLGMVARSAAARAYVGRAWAIDWLGDESLVLLLMALLVVVACLGVRRTKPIPLRRRES